ncbi:hypothetical protein ACYB9R_11370 [Alcaligenes aquatilis]|nr:hypothetical protein [Alcaligenes faecalis]
MAFFAPGEWADWDLELPTSHAGGHAPEMTLHSEPTPADWPVLLAAGQE